jgi:hypothetical protein
MAHAVHRDSLLSLRSCPAELQVRFLSAPHTAYVYLDVPPAYFLGLELARSKGAFINREIKPRFRCLKLATIAAAPDS